MEITDLNDSEKLAMLGLAKLVVRADQELSNEETQQLRALAQEMGGDEFVAKIAEARQRYKTARDAMFAAEQIKRPEAQQLVFERLLLIAESDELIMEEARLLDTLAAKWGISL